MVTKRSQTFSTRRPITPTTMTDNVKQLYLGKNKINTNIFGMIETLKTINYTDLKAIHIYAKYIE